MHSSSPRAPRSSTGYPRRQHTDHTVDSHPSSDTFSISESGQHLQGRSPSRNSSLRAPPAFARPGLSSSSLPLRHTLPRRPSTTPALFLQLELERRPTVLKSLGLPPICPSLASSIKPRSHAATPLRPAFSTMPLPLLLLLAAAASSAHAFTFEFNQTNPRTCEPVLVSWKGGSPPFRLMIIVSSVSLSLSFNSSPLETFADTSS